MRIFVIALILAMASSPALACKERYIGNEYPVQELHKVDVVITARIERTKNQKQGRYESTESFEATVIESYKGDLSKGDILSGIAAIEEAHAVCPVHLEIDQSYILILSKVSGQYSISRFSVTVSEKNTHYKDHVVQIRSSFGAK